MTIRRLVLVDDDPDLRHIALMSLTRVGGWDAVGAASGEDAIRVALETLPDVIILDAMMPGLDGLATLERLRAHAELANTPVVFMTAKIQHSDIDRYLAAGAIGVIPKPFDPLTLPHQLRELMLAAAQAPR